jgi:hypothetical protein
MRIAPDGGGASLAVDTLRIERQDQVAIVTLDHPSDPQRVLAKQWQMGRLEVAAALQRLRRRLGRARLSAEKSAVGAGVETRGGSEPGQKDG